MGEVNKKNKNEVWVTNSFDALEAEDDGDKVNKEEESVNVAHVKEVEVENLSTKDWVNKIFGNNIDSKQSSKGAKDVPVSKGLSTYKDKIGVNLENLLQKYNDNQQRAKI